MVNKTFFKYFSQYSSLEEFKRFHKSIAEFFQEKKGYLKPTKEDKIWIEQVCKDSGKTHKVFLNINGHRYIMSVKASSFYLNKEKLFVVVFSDITELEKINKKLEFMLYHDELTMLPNRRALIRDIKNGKNKEGLCLINIDNFKSINDVYGVRIGDQILKEVSKRLILCLERQNKKDSKVYKLHADEFAILYFHNNKSIKEYQTIISLIIYELTEKPYVFGDYEIFISVSVGVSLSEWIENIDELLPTADVALKTAKKEKKHFVFYKDVEKEKKDYAENIYWTKKLVKALKHDQIKVFYQPIYSIKENKITKFECLVRMIDEHKNVITPYKFLEIAKISKIYPELTKRVIRESFSYCRNCEHEFSINIDIQDILNEDVVEFIVEYIKKYNVGEKLVFEFLETESIGNYEIIKDFINDMKKFGCKFAIDDFGSGYSNFERLMELNISYIKIDSSFIKKLPYDRDSHKIVKLINEFAHTIGAETVAEFVSSKDIFDKVVELGIDHAQGFYIGEPKPKIDKTMLLDVFDRFIT
ncbi:MAG: bifunctional diguanylate cyclase/phosphodiesterase [Aquificae bacterium]|nr:bifunctional diguanylate cyclase/phosphodiesterase [Aquificota bacterium]